jgi:O-antigen ligase
MSDFEGYRNTSHQILAIHTFIAALWLTGIEARSLAFGLVGLACIFIALWVGIGNGVHKEYEAPSPVGYFICYPFIPFPYLSSCLHSIGAGSVLDSVLNA